VRLLLLLLLLLGLLIHLQFINSSNNNKHHHGTSTKPVAERMEGDIDAVSFTAILYGCQTHLAVSRNAQTINGLALSRALKR
jgi:hypothetical protein